MSDEPTKKHGLGGEADPNAWDFVGIDGPLPNPVGHTFPLLTHDATGQWRLIGTGFYISRDGLFVTAKHVIEEVIENDIQTKPLVIFHLRSDSGMFGPQDYLVRPIGQCWIGDRADIALGSAAIAKNTETGEVLSHWGWPIDWKMPSTGAKAATYAFPYHESSQTEEGPRILFHPDVYAGAVESVADYRDSVLLPFPFMQVSFMIHGGASGGPVIGPTGVVGVNRSGFGQEGPGFVTQIRCLQNAFLEGLSAGERIPRRIPFGELVAAGTVNAANFGQASIDPQEGRLVRLDRIPAKAPCAVLKIRMYC